MKPAAVSHGGIHAHCHHLICDENMQIYVLGVAGYQTAVKGIVANALGNKQLHFIINGEHRHCEHIPCSCRVRWQKLPSGLTEAVILPDASADEGGKFILISPSAEHTEELFFRHLDEKTEIPLHVSWSEWLWKTCTENEWMKPLQTVMGNFAGYTVDVPAEELMGKLSEATAFQVPEIMSCFRKGGDEIRILH